MLIQHMTAGALVDKYVPAEAIGEDGFCREEGAPAGDHVVAVAVVFDVRDYAFGEIFRDGRFLLGGGAIVQGGHVGGCIVGGGYDGGGIARGVHVA